MLRELDSPEKGDISGSLMYQVGASTADDAGADS